MDNYTTPEENSPAKTSGSLEELFLAFIEKSLNKLLEAEFESVMGYSKNNASERESLNTDNYRNGSYLRDLFTTYGSLKVRIPRDRNGRYKQKLIPPWCRRTDRLEALILKMYSMGITYSEISELLGEYFGNGYSKSVISNITCAVTGLIDEFKNRRLASRYIAIYADATWLNLRRDRVDKEALHALVGITDEGRKEILSYAIYPNESAFNYEQMLKDIKDRGVEQVLLFVSDGLKGLGDACKKVYPEAKFQRCWVHLMRNAEYLVRKSDRAAVLDMLKKVYRQTDALSAEDALNAVIEKYGKSYRKLVTLFENRDDLFSLYAFPEQIRRCIYSTNVVENIHRQLKRKTKKKDQFPSEDSLERFVFSFAIDLNKKFSERIQPGFLMCRSELDEMFVRQYSTHEGGLP